MTLVDVRVGLRAYLLGDAAIAALVDNGATVVPRYRLFPVKLLQGEIKASIVYSRISNIGDHHMQGPSGLARPRIQIDCYSKSANEADTLANLVKERIDGFRGSMLWGDNSPEEAVVVQGIFFDSERDSYDDATKLYGVSRDYFVWVEER